MHDLSAPCCHVLKPTFLTGSCGICCTDTDLLLLGLGHSRCAIGRGSGCGVACPPPVLGELVANTVSTACTWRAGGQHRVLRTFLLAVEGTWQGRLNSRGFRASGQWGARGSYPHLHFAPPWGAPSPVRWAAGCSLSPPPSTPHRLAPAPVPPLLRHPASPASSMKHGPARPPPPRPGPL